MDNNTSGSRKLFCLKPAAFQKKLEANGTLPDNSSNAFNLGSNPFLKCDEKDEEAPSEATKDPEKNNSTEKSNNTDELFKPAKNNLNLFTNATTEKSSSNFVFGQNLRERVVIDKSVAASDGDKKSEDESSTSNSSKLLFSSALSAKDEASGESEEQKKKKEAIDKKSDSNNSKEENSNSDNSLSLVEAARKYEEMKVAQKRKYEEVEVKTGEEDEKNILEMNCKLFTFDKNNWEERGRGMLRLNDSKNSSRVVFRASGSFRVLLNTKVWRDQTVDQPSSKSLRLTAFDTTGTVKIYLVMGKNEDIDRLFHYLSTRIQLEKDKTPERECTESESTTQQTEEMEFSQRKQESPEPASKKLAASDE